MGETILVTGSTGFIGKRLLRRLQREDAAVRVLLRPESDGSSLPEGVALYRGSFSDASSLNKAVAGVDRIIHLAGVTKAVDEAAYDAGNVAPVEAVLAAVHRCNPGLKRFLLVSSLAAAGPAAEGAVGVAESDTPRPVSAYGRSKLRGERAAMAASGEVPVTIVRPPAVYGPGDRDVLQVFQMLSRGVLVGAGRAERQRFSMIYVDDLVEGIVAAARSGKAEGRLYYLSSLRPYGWEEFLIAARPALGFGRPLRIALPAPFVRLLGMVLGAVGSLTGKAPLINRDKANELLQENWVCSPERAALELGFTAETPLAEGIARTVEWYRRHGWL